jgi:WD40 repeat protein
MNRREIHPSQSPLPGPGAADFFPEASMRRRHRWWFALCPLACFALPVAAGGPTREKARGTQILPETIPLRPGGGLSIRTPVARPRSVKGARSWTVETRRHRWAPIEMALSPDGALVATSGYDGMVRLWEASTGKLVRVLVGHDSYSYGMAFSSDGRYLASTGSFDYTVRIWEAATGLPVKVLKGLKDAPVVVAWSPDGSLLAAGTIESGYVHLWRVGPGTPLQTRSFGKTIVSLAFSPDGQTLACGVSQVGVNFLTAPKWEVNAQIDLKGQDARALSWSADGKQLLAGATSQTVLYDPTAKKVVRRFSWGAGALARHKNRAAVPSPAGMMYDLDTGKPGVVLPAGQATAWPADGKAIYTLSGEHVLRITPDTGKEVGRWSIAEGGTVWWFPSRPMVTGIGTPTPRVWDLTAGKLLHVLKGHTAGTTVVGWSPGGKILATGGPDKTVRVWNPATGKLLRTLTGFEGAVTALAVAGDGRIAAGSADKKVRVFARETVKPSRTFAGHAGAVQALAWGPDSSHLLAGRANHTLQLWDVRLGKEKQSIGVMAPVQSVNWAAGGKVMATCTIDRCVRFWSPANGQLLATVVADKDQMSCISAEGHYRIPNEAQTDLVCVVLTAKGMDTFAPREFAAKFGWKNNPNRARMTGN